MFFLAPLAPVVGAAVESALACEAASMFVGGAATAVTLFSRARE